MKDVTVIYLRLSKEDNFSKDESNSIRNQRALLRKYITEDEKLKLTELVELKDDGYSGKTMERPSMARLMEMIRLGQVKNIVVKDFSRFSRDYLTLGKYLEQIFPFMGIRFIAVNDNYDSDKFQGGIGTVDTAFKTLLYDFYSEDLSKKVKSSLKIKRDGGKYIASFAPYGYCKSDNSKYKLEIDPAAANVVKKIFEAYMDGKSMYRIAKELNLEGVLCPARYIAERDKNNKSQEKWKNSMWGVGSISRILYNEEYIGNTVYNKGVKVEVSKRATKCKPREEWSRIENTHEPIISKELFDNVQEKLINNRRPHKVHHEKSALTGLVICEGCGHRMLHYRGGRHTFVCFNQYKVKTTDVETSCVEAIRVEDLEEIVLNSLDERIKGLKNKDKIIHQENEKHISRKKEIVSKLNSMRNTYNSINDEQLLSYELYRNGTIDKEIFLQQKNERDDMLSKLNREIDSLDNTLSEIDNELQASKNWKNADNHMEISKLDNTLARALIEKIIVGRAGKIEIIWKFKE